MKKISPFVVQIVNQLKAVGLPSTIVAGGYLRDLYMDVEYRDVDLYIFKDELKALGLVDVFKEGLDQYMETILSIIKLEGVGGGMLHQSTAPASLNPYSGYTRIRGFETIGMESPGTIHSVFQINFVEKPDMTFEFIVVDTQPLRYVAEHYDIGLCTVTFDGTKISYSSDFLSDARNNTLTIRSHTLSRLDIHRSWARHIPKLKQKYPNFKVIERGICDKLDYQLFIKLAMSTGCILTQSVDSHHDILLQIRERCKNNLGNKVVTWHNPYSSKDSPIFSNVTVDVKDIASRGIIQLTICYTDHTTSSNKTVKYIQTCNYIGRDLRTKIC